MAIAVKSAEKSIPPIFIFPRKNMQCYFMDPWLKGSMLNQRPILHASGWMKQADFAKSIQHFIKYPNPIREKQALLLRDNYTWNLSIEAIDLVLENVIIMLIFPPHCSLITALGCVCICPI